MLEARLAGEARPELAQAAQRGAGTDLVAQGDEVLEDLMNLRFGREPTANRRRTQQTATNPRREAARSKKIRRQLKF